MMPTANPHIRAAAEGRAVEDTRIMQKVNAAHRMAFREKFPGQIEHCLRLITERLQQGLHKEAPVPISDREAADLSTAIWHLTQVQHMINPRTTDHD